MATVLLVVIYIAFIGLGIPDSLFGAAWPAMGPALGGQGGEAERGAGKMGQVARGKQVRGVTHLPQIAAMADTHFSVQKGERDGRPYTQLEQLDRSGRQKELARLNKEKASCQKDIDFVQNKLNNPGFVAKAPAHLVENERQRLATAQERLAKIEESMAVLLK